MALSEQEQQALREIEQSLLADDPKFGAAVKRAGAFSEHDRGGLSVKGIALFMLGVLILVGGIALSQRSLWFVGLSAGGFLLMFGAAIWMLKGTGRTNRIDADSSYHGLEQKAHGKQRSGGIAKRMEDNFRRRFEN